jgi:nitrous oxidase accessory protein NosD
MVGIRALVVRILIVAGLLVAGVGTAEARVRRVPAAYATIQAAVDAASSGDLIDVAPGSYCGARLDRPVALNGHGRAAIVGCAEGPTLSGGLRAGFILPGADGTSGASGSSIEGFIFDGSGIADDNLEPLAVAIIGTFASDVRIERNVILGTIQAITNTGGDRWFIAGNRIQGLTLFDCTGALCAGGDGIVIQIARDGVAVPGGPESDLNRPAGNVVVGNVVTGAIPDGFATFSMVGIFVLAADRTVVSRNVVSIPDNPDADAIGEGILIDNSCCGQPALLPGSRQTVVTFNDGRDSEIAVEIDGESGENTSGLVLFGNAGSVEVEGVPVDQHPRHRPHVCGRRLPRHLMF